MVAFLLALILAVAGLARAAEPESFAFDDDELAAGLSYIHEIVGGRLLLCPEGEEAASAVWLVLDQTPSLKADVLLLDADGTGPETIEGGLSRLGLACGVRVHSSASALWHLEGVGRCGSYWPDPKPDLGLLSDGAREARGSGTVPGTVVLVTLGVAAAVVIIAVVVVKGACREGRCSGFGAGAIGLRESPWPAHAAVAGVAPGPLPTLGFRF